MSQKILIFDEKFNHISLELYIIEINNIKKPKIFKFILDTGATRTSITLDVLNYFGIDIKNLPTIEVTSIDDIKSYPIINMKGIIFSDSGPEKQFTINNAIVLYDINKIKKHKSEFKLKKMNVNLPNLFGLDLLKEINGKIVLDFRNKDFKLEW
jgi:hypothetical protein